MAIGPVDYFSKPSTAYSCGATIDYNTADGYKKYSVLSNIEIEGGTLVGVEVHWNAPANGIADRQLNKFDPWTYGYTIKVPPGTHSRVIRPRTMSNKIRSMKVNGAPTTQGASVKASAPVGGKISVEIVSPDGTSTSSYTYMIAAWMQRKPRQAGEAA